MTANGLKENDHKAFIYCHDDEQLVILGYKYSRLKQFLTWVLIICTIGFLRLIFHWKPEWMLYCTHKKCWLHVADSILLIDQYKQYFVCSIKIDNNDEQHLDNIQDQAKNVKNSLILPKYGGKFEPIDSVKYFKYKKHKYIWHDDIRQFRQLSKLGENVTCSYLHEQEVGLTVTQQIQRRQLFGSNTIKVPLYSILRLLFLEVLNPFYVFQLFSVSLWYSDEYEQYATAVLLISVVFVSVTVYQLRKNQRALHDTIHQSGIITVCRHGGEYLTVDVEDLVPGDIIVLPSRGCSMFCDAVLLNGNCIINEASLTGESVPVTKTALPKYINTEFDEVVHAKHVLFSGTKLIQTRFYGEEKVKAVIIKTGFMTQKGGLVRSVLFPKPVDFKFSEDAMKFIMALAFLACCGFAYTVFLMHKRGNSASKIAKRALDLITIVIPPALPAAMTVGIIYAQARLKQANIFCISPRFINISGSINCVCFDKTGTLTEDGLDILGVVPVHDSCFCSLHTDVKTAQGADLKTSMATCHSLTVIENEVVGDPLDLKMFQATGWHLEEPQIEDSSKFDIMTPTIVRSQATARNENNEDLVEVGIIRQFPFSSSLQRMSVVTRSISAKRFHLYVKGSPEMIHSLCNSSSVPGNFDEILSEYTLKGYRVIGLAHRVLPKINYTKVQRIERTELECQLTLLGLLVMENRIKAATKPSIGTLLHANIRTVMITGDNILTALSVARQCSMLLQHEVCVEVRAAKQEDGNGTVLTLCDPSSTNDIFVTKESVGLSLWQTPKSRKVKLAVSGKSLDLIRHNHPQTFNKLLCQGVVFARMSPEQKQVIIESLQKCGLFVAMCGDGANDCGALKAAHAGISLSEAEASIASPFTSKTDDISCVPSLIKEGRAALVTSFGMFKYMAIYSMCQFCGVLLLYTLKSNYTDWQFIYIDLFLVLPFAALFGRTASYHKLSKRPPSLSLVSPTPILSLLVHVVIVIAFQTIAYLMTTVQPWYVHHEPDPNIEDNDFGSFDNYSTFSISMFQYIGIAVIFSKGAPYRKSIFTNWLFLGAITILTASSVVLVLYPPNAIISLFEMIIAPSIKFRGMVLLLAASNFIVSFLAEFFIIDFMFSKKLKLDEQVCCSKLSKYKELSDDCIKSENISPLESPMTVLSPISPETPFPPLAYDHSSSDLSEIVITENSKSSTLPSCILHQQTQDDKSDIIGDEVVSDHQKPSEVKKQVFQFTGTHL